MDLKSRYYTSHRKISSLSYELEEEYGRFLLGSPSYIDILNDMLQRGIIDARIQPTIDEYNNVMIELSKDSETLDKLR
jgi:hypothetical protein